MSNINDDLIAGYPLSVRETEPRGFALLKLRDLYLVRREIYGRIERDHADYFYHSHQCPTNLLQDVVAAYGPSGEPDQHGMIRYVAGIEDTPETHAILGSGTCGGLSLRQLLELFGTDGEPIPSDYPEANEGMIPVVAAMRRAGREES